MAKVTSRCELMDNAFAAGPAKLEGKFFVVEDELGEHMVFSADKRGKLCLVLKGESGHNELVNLSEKFEIPDDQPVTALAVSQNRDGKIYLVFAVRQSDQSSKLYVVGPIAAGRDEWLQPTSLTSRLYRGEQWQIQIRDFLLVS